MEFLPLQDRALLRILMITQEVDNKFLSCMSHLQEPSDFGADLHHDRDPENFNGDFYQVLRDRTIIVFCSIYNNCSLIHHSRNE